MAQFYTLEEAAQRLNIPAEEFKRKLKTEWTSIRPFRDGATLRFRAADIDELARSLGAASDPGLPLGPVGAGLTESADDFALSPDAVPPAKTGSDSDVRLDLTTPNKPAGEGSGPTEEIALDVSGPPSSGVLKPPSSGKLSPKPGGSKAGKDISSKSGSKVTKDDSAKIPSATDSTEKGTDSSSEFELSLDSDSDSFELQLTNDSSEEMALGSNIGQDDSGRQSGIDLGKPADSGVSLEKKKPGAPANEADSDVDFELSLDPTGASGVRLGGPKSGQPKRPKPEDSSSEFELTLDDSSGNMDSLAASLQEKPEEGKGDIFETDFELPVMQDESGSEVVAVDADTDLESAGFEVDVGDAAADDESASQVVLIDDDDAGVLVSDDEDALAGVGLEEGPSASKALRGVRDDDSGVRTVIAGPAKWGPVPVIPLVLSLPLAFLGLLMAFELLQTTKGYSSGSKPGGTITRGVADALG
jgi:hypothetical protein